LPSIAVIVKIHFPSNIEIYVGLRIIMITMFGSATMGRRQGRRPWFLRCRCIDWFFFFDDYWRGTSKDG